MSKKISTLILKIKLKLIIREQKLKTKLKIKLKGFKLLKHPGLKMRPLKYVCM